MRVAGFTMLIGFAGMAALGVAGVSAQTYPSRPVHIYTGFVDANGDLVSRLIAPRLIESLGQQVLVENKPSGPILGEVVARAAPDGHTLLVTGSSLWLLPYFQENLPRDPLKDFMPVTLLTSSPSVLVVHPSVPVKSITELIAYAKARPVEPLGGTPEQLAVAVRSDITIIDRIVKEAGSLPKDE